MDFLFEINEDDDDYLLIMIRSTLRLFT